MDEVSRVILAIVIVDQTLLYMWDFLSATIWRIKIIIIKRTPHEYIIIYIDLVIIEADWKT